MMRYNSKISKPFHGDDQIIIIYIFKFKIE